MKPVCCKCGKTLPNRWAVGKRVVVDGVEQCYCHLHAVDKRGEQMATGRAMKREEVVAMSDNEQNDKSGTREEELTKNASGELVKKAWGECSSLVSKLGGGIKVVWAKIHPDRSPEAMLSSLDGDLAENRRRLAEIKPELDRAYRDIVAGKKDYLSAPPARQRILKIELQSLLARYKSLEREFGILCENERSIEMVRGRFLEVLAHGMRGKLNVDTVDRLTDSIEEQVDEAEDVQDALSDLERAGKRSERDTGDFDSELADFDGELGLVEDVKKEEKNEEKNNIDIVTDKRGTALEESDGGIA